MNVLETIRGRFAPILAEYVEDPDPLVDLIRPAQDAKFGDYQANVAMPLGKTWGRPPREVAAEIVAKLDLADLCEEPEIAGPGFINLRLQSGRLAKELRSAQSGPRLGVPRAEKPQTYVIDYSSPNVAKPMHVGHIRSTVIGNALCRILSFVGHRVISDNHLGDWGTQFGMIIYGYRHFANQSAYREQPVQELARVYRVVRRLIDFYESAAQLPKLEGDIAAQEVVVGSEQKKVADAQDEKSARKKAEKGLRRAEGKLKELRSNFNQLKDKLASEKDDAAFMQQADQHAEIATAVLHETAKLHEGDAENKKLWEEFLPHCRDEIGRVYARLDVSFDYEYGESFYHDRLADVVRSLEQKGLARESEGAVCVFLEGFETPMIVRKRDGAFLYATTDLATIAYRLEQWQPDAILYVVDHRQGEHFGKLFAAAHGWLDDDPRFRNCELTHVSFGTVLGEDGRPFKTRAGDTVGLEGLLDEAVARAAKIVAENDDARPGGPELSTDERAHVAETVGIAAIKYADLSQNRTSDYVFSYDKMLAMQGNTATYMQYAYARVRSIFRRGHVDIDKVRNTAAPLSWNHDAERALALKLLQFAEALDAAVADYRPNVLTDYLFQLADRYSTFFENCPVLKAKDEETKTSRLLLSDLTARVLKQGMELLGIQVVEKM